MMRLIFILLHRWVGLTIAGFLIVSGLTGAIISWDHELDSLLNAHLLKVSSQGKAISSLELAQQVEARDIRAHVTYMVLTPEPGKSLHFGVDAHVDPATGKLYELGYNEVFIDPIVGKELGKRDWGAPWPITSENLVSFLYVLHYSLHIPEMWDIDHWGLWLLGGIAILWTLDCFVGFYLTLPSRRRGSSISIPVDSEANGTIKKSSWQRWLPAWKVRWNRGSYKLNFDIHRAFGLWVWGLLFILAFTAFSLNLYSEVFYPMMSKVSKVTPSPFDLREETNRHQPITSKLGFSEIINKATQEARRRNWEEPAGDVFYNQNYGIYGVRFFYPGDNHGSGGVGHAALYYDALDGQYLGNRQPWQGTAADIFVQMQFPLHSGRILGITGRILISIMGLITAALSMTGIIIWWRKRKSRNHIGTRSAA